jgi:hypothetical protein
MRIAVHRRDWFLLFIDKTILREGHMVWYRESRRSFQREVELSGDKCPCAAGGWNGEYAALACYGAEGVRRT